MNKLIVPALLSVATLSGCSIADFRDSNPEPQSTKVTVQHQHSTTTLTRAVEHLIQDNRDMEKRFQKLRSVAADLELKSKELEAKNKALENQLSLVSAKTNTNASKIDSNVHQQIVINAKLDKQKKSAAAHGSTNQASGSYKSRASKLATESPTGMYSVKTYMANVRSMPSMKGVVVSVKKKNDVFKAKVANKYWLQIDKEHYIHRSIVEPK